MVLNCTATNPTDFEKDFKLETKNIKWIKAILGNFFIIKDIQADLTEGTDFLTLTMNPFKIGVRLRRYQYFIKYPNDFTIRWLRPSGVDTEIHKIRNGLVDYILYGFVNESENKIIKYFIGDLDIFRDCEPEPIAILPNNPHDSDLAVYRVNQFPEEFVLKQWQQLNT